MKRGLSVALAVAVIALLAVTGPVAGQGDDELEVEFKIALTGAEEVPAVVTDASGTAEVEIKVKDGVTTIKFEIEVCNIEEVAQAHIHASAPPGANAGVRIFLFDLIADPTMRPRSRTAPA